MRKEALDRASRAISIRETNGGWLVSGPEDKLKPEGPRTNDLFEREAQAVRAARGWKACIAAALLGYAKPHHRVHAHRIRAPWRLVVRAVARHR